MDSGLRVESEAIALNESISKLKPGSKLKKSGGSSANIDMSMSGRDCGVCVVVAGDFIASKDSNIGL